MKPMSLRKIPAVLRACLLGMILTLPAVGQAQTLDEEPTMLAMVSDVALVRPVMFAVTAVGAVTFVATLPFSAMGNNVKEAGDTLVVGPARTTFVRCLGCKKPRIHRNGKDL